MRYINMNGRYPNKKWVRAAKRLTAKLNAAPDDAARAKIIDDNKEFWKELLPWLRKITKRKCWFSESRGDCQYWEVEHFRPKGAAKNLDGTERPEGYWWLAFEWTNYRLCGGVPNRKKSFYFPLRAGTHVACSANRNIDDECPYLLDPTKISDPPLLSFNKNGDISPTPDMAAWNTQRAQISIDRYKLQAHEEFVEGRRDTWEKCENEINKCRNLLIKEDANPTATTREQIRDQMEMLKRMGDFYSEYSAVANDCLRACPERHFQKLASAI